MSTPLNIYDAHAEALTQVQAESVFNASNAASGAGTINFINQQPLPAFIGPFEFVQSLETGGFRPSLRSIVQVTKTNLPASTVIRTGYKLTVTAPGGIPRSCQVAHAVDKFSFWEITVEDVSENV